MAFESFGWVGAITRGKLEAGVLDGTIAATELCVLFVPFH
jgi:hypothetical protein